MLRYVYRGWRKRYLPLQLAKELYYRIRYFAPTVENQARRMAATLTNVNDFVASLVIIELFRLNSGLPIRQDVKELAEFIIIGRIQPHWSAKHIYELDKLIARPYPKVNVFKYIYLNGMIDATVKLRMKHTDTLQDIREENRKRLDK